MKTLISIIPFFALVVSALGQTQGVSQRATNGVAFGEMIVQGHIKATNVNTTNVFSGKFQQGTASAASSASATFGSGSVANGLGSFATGQSNVIQSTAAYSFATGGKNQALDFYDFVGGFGSIAAGSNTFVFGLNNIMEDHSQNSFIIGQGIFVTDGSSNNFVWNSDPAGYALPSLQSNSFNVNAPGGIYFNGVPFTGGGGTATGMKTNQFTTNTVGVGLVGNVNFAGATNNATGDFGVNGTFGTTTATAGTLGVSGNATVNGTLSSSTSTSGVFTVTGSIIGTITNQYAYFDGNGVVRGTNNGSGLTNTMPANVATNNGDNRFSSGQSMPLLTGNHADGLAINVPTGNKIKMFADIPYPGTVDDYLLISPIASTPPSAPTHGQRTFFTIANESGSNAFGSAAILGEIFIPAANTNTYPTRHQGLYGYVHHQGSGTIQDSRAVFGTSGIYGTGNMGVSRGGYFTSSLDAGSTGSMVESIGAEFPAHINLGSGTVGFAYGIKLAAQTIATNNWTIYSAGGNNYFGGKILVATTTDSANGVIQLGNSATNTGISFGTRAAEQMYRNAQDQIRTYSRFFANGFTANDDIRAEVGNAYDIGQTGTKFRSIYLSSSATVGSLICIGAATVSGAITSSSTIAATNGIILFQSQTIPTNSIPSSSSAVTNWVLLNLTNTIAGGGPMYVATNAAASGSFLIARPTLTVTAYP